MRKIEGDEEREREESLEWVRSICADGASCSGFHLFHARVCPWIPTVSLGPPPICRPALLQVVPPRLLHCFVAASIILIRNRGGERYLELIKKTSIHLLGNLWFQYWKNSEREREE